MSSIMNIGSFRDAISVYYKDGSTTSDMGSEVLTYTHFELKADVNQIDGKTAQYFGLDIMVESFKVICRAPIFDRPVKVVYKNATYKVINSFLDKRGLILTMFIIKSADSTSVDS